MLIFSPFSVCVCVRSFYSHFFIHCCADQLPLWQPFAMRKTQDFIFFFLLVFNFQLRSIFNFVHFICIVLMCLDTQTRTPKQRQQNQILKAEEEEAKFNWRGCFGEKITSDRRWSRILIRKIQNWFPSRKTNSLKNLKFSSPLRYLEFKFAQKNFPSVLLLREICLTIFGRIWPSRERERERVTLRHIVPSSASALLQF